MLPVARAAQPGTIVGVVTNSAQLPVAGVTVTAVRADGEAIRAAPASQVQILPTPLLAGAIGRIAVATARRGEVITPGAVRPWYVRRPDAELDRERKAQLGPRQ